MTDSRERQMQRYLDGELPPADAADFAARMLQDGALRERVEQARRLRAGFAAAPSGFAPPAGFTAGVLAEVRRLPSRDELRQRDVAAGAVQLCRRLLLAAVVLLGLGAAVYAGLFDGGQKATLEAAPGDLEREMERLDALILQRMNGK